MFKDEGWLAKKRVREASLYQAARLFELLPQALVSTLTKSGRTCPVDFGAKTETPADVGLLSEYLYDGRDQEQAPVTPFDNDLFLGTGFTLNDAPSTELLLGAFVDLGSQASLFIIEGSRRLGDVWRVEIEGRLFANVPGSDSALTGLENDGYIQLRVARFF